MGVSDALAAPVADRAQLALPLKGHRLCPATDAVGTSRHEPAAA
jgi:hypothetical protein